MNTQTFAQTQVVTAINDDELMAATGGGIGALLTAGIRGAGAAARGGFKFGRDALAADALINKVDGAING